MNNIMFLYRSDQAEWFKNSLGPEFVKVCNILTHNTNYQSIKLPEV